MVRRAFPLLILSAGLLLGGDSLGRDGASIPIYYPSVSSAKDRQDALRTELGRGGTHPIAPRLEVFGRFKDFIDLIRLERPSAVVAPSFFGRFYPEYVPGLVLTQSGSRFFKYQLVALSDRWNLKNLSHGRVGMVEELDREGLKRLLPQLLPSQVKLIKTVSKPEDLFPLLAFRTVDFVLISERDRELLKDKFNMPVRTIFETKPIETPMIYVRKGAEAKSITSMFKAVPSAAWKVLGFSGLESINRSVE